MRKRISNVISDLEKQHDIKILLAVESGSRAWGFP
ncbi:MAG: nucleotidyltransferase domain-containing protein, partial [Firmicutes bacterium]|nr:nucleotidyltransferase domain-containing protein [Bacillota bacterium]